jgi:hypothetical protein
LELADWHRWWKRRGFAGIRAILIDRWDPLGVAGVPEAADEYDTYAGQVGGMLRRGTTPDGLDAYLRGIREDFMGLGLSDRGRDLDRATASALLEWYAGEMAGSPD